MQAAKCSTTLLSVLCVFYFVSQTERTEGDPQTCEDNPNVCGEGTVCDAIKLCSKYN
jgi:hypothetical protein